MFWNILDKKRFDLIPLLKDFKNDFYLAGGTALALQIGHRDSVDFDFFSGKDFDTGRLFQKIKDIFNSHKILKVQDEKNNLTVIIDDEVKLSFFSYPYALFGEIIETDGLRLASVIDIGCMKLSAITGRAVLRDYVDLYFVLKIVKLADLLEFAMKKFKDLDLNLILKSLVYFEDLERGPIKFKNHNRVSLRELKIFFQDIAKKYLR